MQNISDLKVGDRVAVSYSFPDGRVRSILAKFLGSTPTHFIAELPDGESIKSRWDSNRTWLETPWGAPYAVAVPDPILDSGPLELE